MGLALMIVLEREVAGMGAPGEGAAAGHASKGLDRIAEKLGVRPLMGFFGVDEESWFSAEEGVRTVEALLGHLAHGRETLPHLDRVVADLQAFERVLKKAREAGVRWRLGVEY